MQLPAKQRLTPKMQQLLVDFGGEETFGKAESKMRRHHQITVSKECARRHTERTGQVYIDVQADEILRPQLSIHPASERMMLSLDAAKVHTTTSEWRDVKTMTITEVKANGETHQNSYFSRMDEYTHFAQKVQVEIHPAQKVSSPANSVCTDTVAPGRRGAVPVVAGVPVPDPQAAVKTPAIASTEHIRPSDATLITL